MLSGNKFANISMAFVGLMFVLPFLHYVHAYPLTTFYQEWWTALLGGIALFLLFAPDSWRNPEIPRILQLPLGLIVVLLLQYGLGRLEYLDQALLYLLYFLFAALLMILGAKLRELFGFAKMAVFLAISLAIGAELNALIGLVQNFHLHTPLDWAIVAKVSSSVYGNLAQPNHFSNYISLGLISLGLLYRKEYLNPIPAGLLSALLLFTLTLTGSRSSWLYLLMMTVMAWIWENSDTGQRKLLRYSLLLIAGFGIMHLIVKLPFMSGSVSSIDTMQRVFGDGGSGEIRLFLWKESLMMFWQSPFLGVGFGRFAWNHFQLLPLLQPNNVFGLYNNAHDLVFHLAAEAGLAGLLVLFASLGVWTYGSFRFCKGLNGPVREGVIGNGEVRDPVYWWGYSILGVLAIHSLLEYPLWYMYFLSIAAILLGAMDRTTYALKMPNLWRLTISSILVLCMFILFQVMVGYRNLVSAMAIRDGPVTNEAIARYGAGIQSVYGKLLLTPYAELEMVSMINAYDEHLKQKLTVNTRVMHFVPIKAVVYRQAILLAKDGQLEQAKKILNQAIWSYPEGFGRAKREIGMLAEKDPAHFSSLLEFGIQKYREHDRAIHK